MSRNVILTINPGTTTTRCALFAAEGSRLSLVSEQSLGHEEIRMAEFSGIADQLGYRSACVAAFLDQAKRPDDRLIAIAGRGGMLTPVPAGVILINDELVDFALHTPVYDHASNLGAPLAQAIAAPLGIPAYIVDPVSVDELTPVARLSGFEEIPRFSFVHALNIRACGRKLAGELGKPFDELRAVVAHLGAGFSIATLLDGKIADSSNRMEISPFTPERAGGLPPLPLIELCYSGKYDKPELLKKLYGEGGVYGYLGTKDIQKIESRVAAGDAKAALVYDAMLYQIRKAIGAMASVANFELDGIILTGGLANSAIITDRLIESTRRIAPVSVYPGSNECLALAEGVLRVLDGQEVPMTWPVTVGKGVGL
ncbi:butyrate kinase [Halomonas campisalis]|uniref:Probable butyrate kinase n=1 Tax=Billgrantia campisalis TaxID=74661 RepID=A0ABS9PBR2_9GAMM|nr:butyrate kinase [Halomonas campisalis]MCG6659111.1 butyrate kinase [Halomonas campisalis]MDR5863854.1 butyrate kinase [Halomonas campisalis]